jgi:hypothetical protein
MMSSKRISRRDTFKLTALGVGALATRRYTFQDFPVGERLGRVCVGRADIKVRPDGNSQTLEVLYDDAVVPWLSETVGEPYNIYASNLRWVETPRGFIWAPHLQPVRNQINPPVDTLPDTSMGSGMWVEVTVPWTDLILANPPPRSPWLKENPTPRLYYSQILWVDQIQRDDQGRVLYRINEPYGSYGDIFWAEAAAFRPLSEDDVSPIQPEVEDKRVLINLQYQTLSCFEGQREVFFCRISSGAKFDAEGRPVEKWSTPIGAHPIWRKVLSLHMSGGTTGGGYDLPGIGWTTLFVGTGIAIHATYWHNNFGVPLSHGCVNARPQDARWIFRWTTPIVSYDPGDITVSMPGGTKVEVIEG